MPTPTAGPDRKIQCQFSAGDPCQANFCRAAFNALEARLSWPGGWLNMMNWRHVASGAMRSSNRMFGGKATRCALFDVMIQRRAAGACLSTLSNAPSTAAKPAADWPSFRAVSWIRSKDGKRSKIFAAGRRVLRAVEDAGPVYNRLIGSTPVSREPDPLIDCHAANGRLQDVRRAPRARREPRRRGGEVEDVGPRGEARRSHQHFSKRF